MNSETRYKFIKALKKIKTKEDIYPSVLNLFNNLYEEILDDDDFMEYYEFKPLVNYMDENGENVYAVYIYNDIYETLHVYGFKELQDAFCFSVIADKFEELNKKLNLISPKTHNEEFNGWPKKVYKLVVEDNIGEFYEYEDVMYSGKYFHIYYPNDGSGYSYRSGYITDEIADGKEYSAHNLKYLLNLHELYEQLKNEYEDKK